jgi:hypothetical protein
MAQTRKKNAWKPWHGFAIEIGPDTDLRGDGLLILEYADGGYEPIGAVCSVNEAQEIAAGRMVRGCTGVVFAHDARGGRAIQDAGTFKLWARGVEGRYLTVPVVIDGVRK